MNPSHEIYIKERLKLSLRTILCILVPYNMKTYARGEPFSLCHALERSLSDDRLGGLLSYLNRRMLRLAMHSEFKYRDELRYHGYWWRNNKAPAISLRSYTSRIMAVQLTLLNFNWLYKQMRHDMYMAHVFTQIETELNRINRKAP